MEIRALSLRVTEEELNGWIGRVVESSDTIHRLQLGIRPGSLFVDGQVEFMGQPIPFDATVEPHAQGGYVALRLSRFEAAGFFPLPAWFILKKLQKYECEWLRVDTDTVVLNVEHLLQERGIALATNLSAVRCDAGVLFLEAQAPPEEQGTVEEESEVAAAVS